MTDTAATTVDHLEWAMLVAAAGYRRDLDRLWREYQRTANRALDTGRPEDYTAAREAMTCWRAMFLAGDMRGRDG